MFAEYLARLSNLAQSITHENFVEVQKVEADILNNYGSTLTHLERTVLCSVISVIKTKMREQLIGSRGV